MTHQRKPLVAPTLASLPPVPDWLVRELRSDEARALHGGRPGPLLRLWAWIVGAGSAAAVMAAKRI